MWLLVPVNDWLMLLCAPLECSITLVLTTYRLIQSAHRQCACPEHIIVPGNDDVRCVCAAASPWQACSSHQPSENNTPLLYNILCDYILTVWGVPSKCNSINFSREAAPGPRPAQHLSASTFAVSTVVFEADSELQPRGVLRSTQQVLHTQA